MRDFAYNDTLIAWFLRQPNKQFARLTVRNITGVRQQTLYNWLHKRRRMSRADITVLRLYLDL